MNEKGKSTLLKFENMMRVKNYSEQSIKSYIHYANVFLGSFDCDACHIGKRNTEKWLIDFKYTSTSQQNQIKSSIRLLCRWILKVNIDDPYLERPRKEKKIPYIMNKELVINTLNSIQNSKHRAVLTLTYSCGLRRSEIVNLKLSDFNKEEKIIYIRNAKGRKDRIVALSENTRNILAKYYREYKPKEYLFNGQKSLQYSVSSCNNIMKKYFGQDRHIHELRHCYASHCLDNGVDTRVIQSTLGHSSIKTVQIYTHVSPKLIRQAVAI